MAMAMAGGMARRTEMLMMMLMMLIVAWSVRWRWLEGWVELGSVGQTDGHGVHTSYYWEDHTHE